MEKEADQIRQSKESKDVDVEKFAKRRVKIAIYFIKITDDNNIKVSENDIVNYLYAISGGNQQQLEQMIEYYKKNVEFQKMVSNQLIENKGFDFVNSNINKNNIEKSYDEIKDIYQNLS